MATPEDGAPRPLRSTPRPSTTLATLALILAFLMPPLGLVLAIIALVQIQRAPRRYGGRGLAIAGTAISVPMVALFFLVGSSGKQCRSNVATLSAAAATWSSQHEGRLPDAGRWVDELLPLLPDPGVLKCSRDKSGARTSYGMNAALSGADINALPDPGRVVLFYETAHPGDNPWGGPEDVARGRHFGRAYYAFVNGKVGSAGSTGGVAFGTE